MKGTPKDCFCEETEGFFSFFGRKKVFISRIQFRKNVRTFFSLLLRLVKPSLQFSN